MNYFITLLTALILSGFAIHPAVANPVEEDPNSTLRMTITKLLKGSELDLKMEEEVRISFYITNDCQVVVLKTDARSEKLDKYIKSSLNYKKIKIEDLEVNCIFHMKVHFLMS